eukprot:gene12512-12600_t
MRGVTRVYGTQTHALAGKITFEGKPIGRTVPEGIGVVFQEDASFPWLTHHRNRLVPRPRQPHRLRSGLRRDHRTPLARTSL